jgi:hypothetical protein
VTSQSVNNSADYKVRVKKNAAGETVQCVYLDSAGTFATNQATITTSAAVVVPANASRRSVTIVGIGTTDAYLGVVGVTTGTGVLLVGVKGAAMTIETAAAIYGIVASGTQVISYIEELDS